MKITVDDAVREMIIADGVDYRLSTTCSGPALIPTMIKPPKASDMRIPINDELSLYVSRVQLDYVSHITIDMMYDPEKLFSCAALGSIRGLY
ncbi:MAG: hypothetical protein LBE47_00310 [Methanomassiliicoccaceae archaeon]|jgi:hypothetical protein|nr:hypothetical protein [Methanomassiliicoccaceae archaeon]